MIRPAPSYSWDPSRPGGLGIQMDTALTMLSVAKSAPTTGSPTSGRRWWSNPSLAPGRTAKPGGTGVACTRLPGRNRYHRRPLPLSQRQPCLRSYSPARAPEKPVQKQCAQVREPSKAAPIYRWALRLIVMTQITRSPPDTVPANPVMRLTVQLPIADGRRKRDRHAIEGHSPTCRVYRRDHLVPTPAAAGVGSGGKLNRDVEDSVLQRFRNILNKPVFQVMDPTHVRSSLSR